MPTPAPPPDFAALHTMTMAQLARLGCRVWDESGLMLFPAAWADSIPEGFEVRSILGRDERFSKNWPPGKLDQRFGFLAFGVMPSVRAEREAPQVSRREDGAYTAGPPPDGRTVAEHLAELTSSRAPTTKDSTCPGCGGIPLDGHITCGLFGCNEAGRR